MSYKREIQMSLLALVVFGLYLTLVLKQANVAKSFFKSRRAILNTKSEASSPDLGEKVGAAEEEAEAVGEKIYVDPRHDHAWRSVLSERDRTATEAIPPQVVIV